MNYSRILHYLRHACLGIALIGLGSSMPTTLSYAANIPVAKTTKTAGPATNIYKTIAIMTAANTSSKKMLHGKININIATAKHLSLLPGIGKTKANRILAWRKKHGPFQRLKDLRRVKGIGKKTVRRLKPYLTLKGPTTLRKR